MLQSKPLYHPQIDAGSNCWTRTVDDEANSGNAALELDAGRSWHGHG